MLIVYTAITNNYDTLRPQPEYEGVKYVCFTDQEDLRDVSGVWDIKYLNKLDHKKPKILANQYIHGLEAAVWIDGNITLKKHPQELIDCLGKNDIAVFRARDYDCVYKEMLAVRNIQGVPQDKLAEQMRDYVAEGLPDNSGLWACTVLVWKNSDEARRFQEGWWEQINKYTRRDQISFGYLIWKTGFCVSEIPGSIYENEYVHWHKKHLKG